MKLKIKPKYNDHTWAILSPLKRRIKNDSSSKYTFAARPLSREIVVLTALSGSLAKKDGNSGQFLGSLPTHCRGIWWKGDFNASQGVIRKSP